MSERDINQNASMELFAKALLGQTRSTRGWATSPPDASE